ncbi:MAG TPA: pilus assembly protein PilM [Vicinamibacterales bacterium]|jgi:type IV pilus assembly protein PilM|nr:pilus assembly protein PilM [Vicinamibacterales bacterium]
MSPLPSLFASAPPSVGVEIAADRISAVSLVAGGSTVASYATERLAPGVVTPGVNGTNIQDRAAVTGALRSAFDKLGTHPRRVALVIPDTAAKLSLLRFEKVPPAKDLEQLIRWQVRKAAPFKPEESIVSWVPGIGLPGGGREFIVTQARRDIVESYEAVCDEAGAQAGVVDLATLNLINAAIAGGAGTDSDWLLVHVAYDYATLAIVRATDLIFVRTRALETPGDLADLVHQTSMYHEDRLESAQFSRVILAGAHQAGMSVDDIRQNLEERLGVRVEPLDFRGSASLRERIKGSPDLIDSLAPALGIILRERIA